MMNRMKMTAALACALLTTGVTFAQLPAEVTTKFNEAAELINQKKFIEAIPILETVLTEGETADPESDIVAQASKIVAGMLYSSRSYGCRSRQIRRRHHRAE